LYNDGKLLNYYDENWVIQSGENIETAFGQVHVIIPGEKRGFSSDLFTMWVSGGQVYDSWFGVAGSIEDYEYSEGGVYLDNVEFPCLKNNEKALEFLYGKDWGTPKKNFKGKELHKFSCVLRDA